MEILIDIFLGSEIKDFVYYLNSDRDEKAFRVFHFRFINFWLLFINAWQMKIV